MAFCPPFRTFVNSIGITPKLASCLPLSLKRANILTDIPHLSQWYWMLCRLTLDIAYTINGKFPIHHTYTIDKTHLLPPQRIIPGTMKFALQQQDTSLEISTSCNLDFCDIYADAAFVNAYQHNRKPYQNDILMPLNMQVGLSFIFVEQADNGDFSLTTIKNFSQEKLLHSFSANFIGHPLPFYLSTEYPEDIEGKIDHIIIKHDFFEIKNE